MTRTEEETNSHPHAFMGRFVHDYEGRIKPWLEQGDVSTARIPIGDALMRFSLYQQERPLLDSNFHAEICYEFAIRYLSIFWEESKVSDHIRRVFMLNINRQVAQMDLIMSGDETYEKHRERDDSAQSKQEITNPNN